jgi:AcrR family transcriptional regulator
MNSATINTAQRGRPRSSKKRREIMRAAIELFTRNGYEGTSVDDVAAAAGVSKQTVYSHYGSKENLFGLAVSTVCKQSGMDADAIDMQAPPEQVVRQIARQFMELITSPEATRVHAVCTVSTETHPELGRLFFAHGPQQAVGVVAQYLTAQAEAGTLAISDGQQAAWQLLSMLKAEAQMRLQFKLKPLGKAESEAYLESCVNMFLRAYAAP